MKLKILFIAVCCLCVGCAEESVPEKKGKLYKLELRDSSGKVVRVVEETEVTVYPNGFVQFKLANGHDSYWRGDWFAEEIKYTKQEEALFEQFSKEFKYENEGVYRAVKDIDARLSKLEERAK